MQPASRIQVVSIVHSPSAVSEPVLSDGLAPEPVHVVAVSGPAAVEPAVRFHSDCVCCPILVAAIVVETHCRLLLRHLRLAVAPETRPLAFLGASAHSIVRLKSRRKAVRILSRSERRPVFVARTSSPA